MQTQIGPIETASRRLLGDTIKPPVERNPLSMTIERQYAEGGAISETPEQLMARMAAKYGAPTADVSREEPAPAPAAQPAPAPAAKPKNIFDLMRGRKEQIDKAAGYANGGKIKGPGTPKSDSIRGMVRETREPIKVSTDERILSAEQDAVLENLARTQGFDSLDAMLEAATGSPVGPTVSAGKKAAATGMAPETNPMATLLTAGNAPYSAGSAADPHASFSPPQREAPKELLDPAPANPNPTPNMMTSIDSLFPTQRRFALGGAIDPGRDYSMPEGRPIPMAPRAQVESVAGLQERAFQAPSTPRNLMTPAPQTNPMASLAAVTGAPGVQVAPRPRNSFAESGTTMDSRNPLTSINMRANNESLAKTNAIRQSMINGDGSGPKVAMLGNSGLTETRNLMDKWGREGQAREMAQEMGRNPKAANALAGLFSAGAGAETTRRGQDINQETAQSINAMDTETARRGQDVTAQTKFAELAGNPLDNEFKRTQIDTEQLGVEKSRLHNEAVANLNAETDPMKRQVMIENMLAAQGKDSGGERLTLPMLRTNAEIDAARKTLAGLSPEEIRRRTAKQTNTGRDNPDFDPTLESALTLSGRRKIGADDHFDQRMQQESPPAGNDGDQMTRFRMDPAMKGHRLGQQTEKGYEVLDSAGKLVGHYR